MDGIILVAIVIPVFIAICQFMFYVVNSDGGTKGISKDAYYGKKTGKLYTADKSRDQHIV